MIKKTGWLTRRKFLLGSGALLGGGLLSSLNLLANVANYKKKSEVKPRLGVNLNGVADWSTEQPFVDYFRSSREWVSQSTIKDAKWGAGPKLGLDEFGWITHLPQNAYATRMISSVKGGHYPSGEYVVLFDGEGDLSPNYVGKIIKREAGRLVIKVDATKGSFMIDLKQTNPKNYLRNIRVIAPGFESVYQTNPWNPSFLKRWSGVACIRMMDFMATNDSKQSQWQDRPKMTDASFMEKGVPVELMVDLANRLNTDVWFCMPHKADDNYIKAFASFVYQHLDPSLRVWVEYSNEVWNSQFEQTKYTRSKGRSLGLSDDDNQAGYQYTAYRSGQMFSIWDDVYRERSGMVVKVLPAFAGYAGVANGVLTDNNVTQKADVLAIAPYVGFSVAPEDKVNDKAVASWSLDKLFEHINSVELPKANAAIVDHKAIADKYNLKLVAYESGQHLVARGAAVNNEKLTELFLKANADKRMGVLYKASLAFWTKAGGDLNCTFNSMSRWTKWGSWGLLQNNTEDPQKSAKFTAVIDWAVKQGQKMHY